MTPVRSELDVDRVGVPEEIVHVAEDFLICTDQEHPEQIRLTLAHVVQRQARFHTLAIDEMVAAAVRVAVEIAIYNCSARARCARFSTPLVYMDCASPTLCSAS